MLIQKNIAITGGLVAMMCAQERNKKRRLKIIKSK